MIINFHLEAAKRRDRPGKARLSSANLYEAPKQAVRPTYPTPECGSGWYHDAAVSDSTSIRSHRD